MDFCFPFIYVVRKSSLLENNGKGQVISQFHMTSFLLIDILESAGI